ncbi:MAG: RHS repeat-associated core domain-containing protein [Pseudomonadota bacterium]
MNLPKSRHMLAPRLPQSRPTEQNNYDANGNMSTRAGNSITWSSYNLPTLINGSGVSASFSYGPDRQRKQQVSTYTTDGTVGTETTIYVGGIFEIETTPAQTHYKHFVSLPGGTRVIYDLQSVSGAQTTYITADHLGSGNLLINSAGTVQVNESYSAYGYRRGSNWASPLAASSADYATIAATTRRGFSDGFHEMLDNVGLIHMNGRVYDPVIGRFLSADPVIAMIGNSQSGNSYAYVQNRPITLTDPTGFVSSSPKPGLACIDNCSGPRRALPDSLMSLMYGGINSSGGNGFQLAAPMEDTGWGGVGAGASAGMQSALVAQAANEAFARVTAATSNVVTDAVLASFGVSGSEEVTVTAPRYNFNWEAVSWLNGPGGTFSGFTNASNGVPRFVGEAAAQSITCSGPSRVMEGNVNSVGSVGGILIPVSPGSAAVVPRQFPGGAGSGGSASRYLRSIASEISGITAGGQSFTGVDDVINDGRIAATALEAQNIEMARDPGRLLIEIVTGYDEGRTTVTIHLPGVVCPASTLPVGGAP